MKRNYSELIKDKQKRILTAKGYKFLWRCIDIAADQRGLCRYSHELKDIKNKLQTILNHLIIDKEMTIDQIKELVQHKKLLND